MRGRMKEGARHRAAEIKAAARAAAETELWVTTVEKASRHLLAAARLRDLVGLLQKQQSASGSGIDGNSVAAFLMAKADTIEADGFSAVLKLIPCLKLPKI